MATKKILTDLDLKGDLEISKLDRANGANLAMTNSFEGSGWIDGDVIGTFDFKITDTSATQKVRGQIKLLNDGAGSSTYPFSNVMVFSTALNNNLIEALRLNSDQSATFADSVTATSFIGSGSQLTGVVKTTGSQEVGGFKRFTNDIALANTDVINTLKLGRLDGYTYAQSSRFIGMYLVGLSGSNNIVIGGGTGGAKSATQITFATNSDAEALSSTNRVLINHLKAEFFVPIIGDGSQLTGVASAAQGVLADTALQPLIDNTNVIFRNDGVNTFNISRDGNLNGSSPYLDMINDSLSTRLRATGALSFWNRGLNGTLSESARFTEGNNFAVGQITASEKVDVLGNVKAKSFLAPLITITADTLLTISNSEVIIDSSIEKVTATLPTVASVPIGKKYTIIAYRLVEPITLETSSSQQIRQTNTDAITSITLSSGNIYTVVNTGDYWQIINKI
jgi:hypothetical protein